jgi:hypothetical protein
MNTYNGWKNYETWVYNLHLTNEGDVMRDYFEQLSSMNAYELGQYLKEELDEQILGREEILPSLLCDLLMSASSEIDFREIAEHLLNDYNNEND